MSSVQKLAENSDEKDSDRHFGGGNGYLIECNR
jgi:hypothetical protein